jgi:hypothetical protein
MAMIACPSVFGAWTGHNEFSRALAEDVTIALDATYPKREAAAADMDLHPADLSRQLSGRDPLNLWRLAALGWPFWIAFCVARMARVGGVVLTADQLTFIKGFAALPKRMARMVLASRQTERRSA